MCNTLLTSTIIVAFLVAVTEAQDFAGSDFVWKDSLKELLTVYNHSADEDIDHAIDEHWESVKLFASTVRPNLTAEQLEEGIFLERTIESRVAISTELDTCISSQLAAKPIAAISVHDKIKKKILNNRRFSQIEILRFCPNTRANCTNIAAIGNQQSARSRWLEENS
ncbi:uncharacterized protein LOC111250403 isoform X2 [Varroa destructor]|uniref:Uncharacterized protein n=1 Tax=Varroa destructor TaxID=109461 RepID=A0A7M7K720_VARDE|nr:uncharacterized protein LOC111250403 isoform X2 [Varroa destructor]